MNRHAANQCQSGLTISVNTKCSILSAAARSPGHRASRSRTRRTVTRSGRTPGPAGPPGGAGPGPGLRRPRSRRRRTLNPDQRALPFPEPAQRPTVCAYSSILANLDVSTSARAASAEYWYRHRTVVENLFRDSRLGASSLPLALFPVSHWNRRVECACRVAPSHCADAPEAAWLALHDALLTGTHDPCAEALPAGIS